MEKLLLRDKELSQILSLSLSFLRRDRIQKTPKIPFIRVGRCVRYDLEQVRAWINSQARTPVPAPETPVVRRRGRPRKA